MDYRRIFKNIKAGGWQGVYLFFGEEEYIKQEALNQTIETLVDPSLRDLNYAQMDGSLVDLDYIINACETLPFMADKRLVVIKDLPVLKGRSDGGIDETGFLDYIKGMSETTCLILYCRDSVDKRRKIYRSIKSTDKALEFRHIKGRELYTWINQTVERHGKRISFNDANHLVDLVGNNLEDISNELKKLISYVGRDTEINVGAMDQVIVPTLEQSIFQLVDAIGEKRAGEALSVLGNLIYGGEQAIQPILAMIARQFRLILQSKGYHNMGYTYEAIAAKLKQRLFVVRKCLAQGRNFTVEQLKKGLNLCLETDYEIKLGRIKDTMALELIIIKMCSQ
ncbi:MAG TPA: DNA polymerase III subunit delta [Clostridia bacterium]|nr:DNA polymerase III subunit delta [Clostridia bacterium]